ncbi:MAG: signal peptide peptidase SppA [Bacteroidales bacterium]|jgi:protease-4|nr:signal peptide peptidase SppA [Bacteroidales bacterium]
MKSFFKYVFATVVGIILTYIICMVIGIIFLTSIIAGISPKTVSVKENSVLRIDLSNEIPDKVVNEFNNFDFTKMKIKQVLGLNDILRTIEKAKTDVNVKGIYLDLSSVSQGFSTLEEIRNKLIEFKDTKKFIIAYSSVYSQGAYYLASVADKIYLNPQGGIDWKGLNMEVMFYSGLMEKIGVEAQIFRHGQFKSAIEPFINKEMSEPNKRQSITLIQSLWDDMCTKISASRGISIEKLNLIADNLDALKAKTALDDKMVDGIKYYDEVLTELSELSGNSKSNKDMFVSLFDYSKSVKPNTETITNTKITNAKIAVIFAEGEIVDGSDVNNNIAGDNMAEIIRKVREDKDVKAVVLRVNSPGGSGLASEIIWRELNLTRAEKPVVVSMGNYAASGGYYISCPSNYIFAQPNTITGSIGVFGMLPNVQKLMNDKLGITIDGVRTNQNSGYGQIYRPVNDAERIIIQNSIEEFYDTFLTRVSDGRNIEKSQVDSIGQGRVWSGINALEIKLIDGIGGLNDALKKAVELAELNEGEYVIREYPEKTDMFSELFNGLSVQMSERKLKEILGENYEIFKTLNRIQNMKGIQARMDYQMVIY